MTITWEAVGADCIASCWWTYKSATGGDMDSTDKSFYMATVEFCTRS